jgi:nitrous oxidase accessory protein
MNDTLDTASEQGREADEGSVCGEGASASASGSARARARRGGLLVRLLLLAAVAALLISPRYPYWSMKLNAPQYPHGLTLLIYPHRVDGDVREIDSLNHYIGMRRIDTAAMRERRLGVPVLVLLAACLAIAAAWPSPSRWVVLLVIPAIVFPPVFLLDLYWWLRDSGLHLDPKSPLSSSVKPFVPQVLGSGKIAQFRTEAWVGVGYYLSLFALGVAISFCHLRLSPLWRRRTARPERVQASRSRSGWLKVGAMMVGAGLLMARPLRAETLVVQPQGSPATIAEALAQASKGDTIVVRGGVHRGPLRVAKPVRLVGAEGPIIDGGGRGTVVRLEAPGATLRGFTIRSSGILLEREDVGVLGAASDLVIEDNRVEDVLFGIYLRQAPRSVIRRNQLRGKDLPLPRRGDLIRLWYSNDVTLEANTTRGGRDAVLWYSNHLAIRDNRLSGGRYGLHFMYCDDATVAGNQLHDNLVGAFLMYSRRLQLRENWIASNRGASGYGIGLKDMESVDIAGNVLAGNKVGIFLEHATGQFTHNLLADNDKGMVIYPSATGNRFEGNSFLENREQVVIEGFADTMTTNRWQGNYWSDYRGYDADGDGQGDRAYRPARLFERLADRQPALRMFGDGPSAQAIDFAARVFPVFEPKPKFVDESPRMRPLPAPLVLAGLGQAWPWWVLGTLLPLWPLALFVGRARGAEEPRGRLDVLRPEQDADAPACVPSSPDANPNGESLAAISVRGLTKRFGTVRALDELGFEVRQGETVALWGPNGAGKTTVLRCLLGLLPFHGSMEVLGQRCGPRGRASRARIGYVPQEVRLHADQSVRDTVRFFARLRRVSPGRADQLLDAWGLKDVERRPVRQLSGGMKQKLALVVALLADPPVLLLDEPTSNLDAATRSEFAALLEGLKAAGKTMLFCTHRQSEVWRLADRVIVLQRGRKVVEGPPEQVREHLLESAHLSFTVPADQSAAAVERLRAGGFTVDGTGPRLWVEAPAGRKLEAIELLKDGGVQILDFDVESDRASSHPFANH